MRDDDLGPDDPKRAADVSGWRMMPDDMTIRIDGSLEGMASIAAATPSREAILEAAQALEDEQNERRSMHPTAHASADDGADLSPQSLHRGSRKGAGRLSGAAWRLHQTSGRASDGLEALVSIRA